ncbi:MAG: hypothetical protein ACQETH_03675 [Candidatus Rifleibacteriota bacterium]
MKNKSSSENRGSFDQSLQAVENEVLILREKLDRMIVKYNSSLKELNMSKTKNFLLEREMERLKNRQAALMGQIRKDTVEHFPVEINEIELN